MYSRLFSKYANDNIKENSREECKIFVKNIRSCFVEFENHECMPEGGDEKIPWNFSLRTWWTQQTTKLFTLETFVVYGMHALACRITASYKNANCLPPGFSIGDSLSKYGLLINFTSNKINLKVHIDVVI